MSRRRVDIESAGPGFIPHGHLMGTRAFVIRMSAGEGAACPTVSELRAEVQRHKMTRVHIIAAPRGSQAGADLAHFLSAELEHVTATMSFHAGEFLTSEALVYESVLLVAPGDLFSSEDLDRRAGSVSVSYWPGSAVMEILSGTCDAPYGQFLVLPREDFGEAKVWLSTSDEPHWQLLPRHDYDQIEDAELTAMGAFSAKIR